MRITLPIALVATLCLALAAALQADEEPSALEEAKLTIHLLEKRVHAQDVLVKTLFQRLRADADVLQAWREGTATRADLVERQIHDLEKALATERDRNGLDTDVLGMQLAKEQQRHVSDVMQLQQELSRANETAEANRIEATNALQRMAVVDQEKRLLRDHIAYAARLFGQLGPAAKPALGWLEDTKTFHDDVLDETVKRAIARITGKPDEE